MQSIMKKIGAGIFSLGIIIFATFQVQARNYSTLVVENHYSYGVYYDPVELAYPYYPYFPKDPQIDPSKKDGGVNPFHPLVNRHLHASPSYGSMYMY